jgi:asparagine synthase (glutamine-hydrolysing)
MCGIAGYIGTRRIDDAGVDLALKHMARRGPDATGVHRESLSGGRHLLMLHSRLSILDLGARANQPYRRGPKSMVFNGEIYNYLELKAILEKEGYSFETTSDTEVLLHALDRWDWLALDRCDGMWALAHFDARKGSLLLSRDRFGEKPLYLHRDSSGLYFASEPKFLFALLGKSLPVNKNHLRRYLVNGYKSLYKTRETFFEGLEELPARSALVVDPSGKETRNEYWTPKCQPQVEMSREDAVKATREHLMRAVEIRLRADVPLAFCMSGGIDSNSLISIAKREFDYDVHGFTIVTTDARYEEQDMVECGIKELGIKHTPIPTETANFLPQLRTLVKQHDAPVYTITYYAHWLLQKSIAEHGYKISLSGTGADELFTGYYDHHLAYLKEVHSESELYEPALEAWKAHVEPIVRNPLLRNPNSFVDNPGMREHIYLNADEFAGYLTTDWKEPFTEERYTESLLRNRMLNEMFHESVPVILHEDDLNAMYYSIENRSPFLDRPLFEFCNSIPDKHLICDGFAKSVLRDSMRGIVPDPILDNRRKVGFNAPIFDYLRIKDPEVRVELLKDSPVWEIVRKAKIEALLAKPELPNSESKFLFYFLNTKLFLEEAQA